MQALSLLILFLILMVIGMPVSLAIGVATTVIIIASDLPLGIIPSTLYGGLNSFIIIAIPFFLLAGELMTASGILERLLDLTRLMVGRFKGGLYHMNILISMLFGGINGSAVADTGAVGSMLIPATIKEYGDPDYAAAVTACSSVVGPIIPPSLPMLVYAFKAGNVSVGALFMAGIIPGALLGFGMMVVTQTMIAKKNIPRSSVKYDARDVFKILRRAVVAMVLPLIMVGGVVSGVFTPSEAGCIAVAYALFVGFFVTKGLNSEKIYRAFINTARLSGIIFLIISLANLTGWWLSIQRVPQTICELLQSLTSNKEIFLLLVICLYLIVGLFIEVSAALIMLVPVLAILCSIFRSL